MTHTAEVRCEEVLRSEWFPADLFGWWRAVFNGGALGLGGRRRSFQEAWAGDRRGRGAAAGPVWVACTRVVHCRRKTTRSVTNSTTWDLTHEAGFLNKLKNPERVFSFLLNPGLYLGWEGVPSQLVPKFRISDVAAFTADLSPSNTKLLSSVHRHSVNKDENEARHLTL